jgi:nucleoside-diphosphate-sugar epimerase
MPGRLVRPGLIPFVPDPNGRLVFQAVHSLDVGEAYRLALRSEASGAFNVAAEPVLDSHSLARLFGARVLPVPPRLLVGAAALTWHLRLQPSPRGWVDMGLAVPVMDTARAREVLGWRPRRSSEEALMELLEGMRDGEGLPTPPLDPAASGRLRLRELLTGVGGRNY